MAVSACHRSTGTRGLRAPWPRLDPTEQVIGERSALFVAQSVEIRLRPVGREDPPGSRRLAVLTAQVLNGLVLVGEYRSPPSAMLCRASATAATAATFPTSASQSSRSGVSPVRSQWHVDCARGAGHAATVRRREHPEAMMACAWPLPLSAGRQRRRPSTARWASTTHSPLVTSWRKWLRCSSNSSAEMNPPSTRSPRAATKRSIRRVRFGSPGCDDR
jgi:hypothetical protein